MCETTYVNYDMDGECHFIIQPEELVGWKILLVELFKPGVYRIHALRAVPNHLLGDRLESVLFYCTQDLYRLAVELHLILPRHA